MANWTHYESVDAFLADVKAKATPRNNIGWCGDTWEGAMDKAEHGDLSAVAEAEAIMDNIDHQVDIRGLRPQWADSMVGTYPNVPAYLAGAPEAMRARVNMPSSVGPVKIFFSPVCSAGVSSSDARKRGMAVLSLVMALQRIRPVQVHIFTAYGSDTDHTIQIRTEPMVLAEAAHCLTATSFYRALGYMLAESGGWRGDWAHWYKAAKGNEAAIEAAIRKQVKAEPDDLIIPPMDSTHGAHLEMISTPAKWINRILDKYRG